MRFLCLISVVVFAMMPLDAQDVPPDINQYLSRIEKGRAEEVRAELPSLLSRYPNNPGVIYVQGVLTTDGTEAVRIYQSIVDNFPQSEWADDALYKVYQFYYSIGLYRTAEIKLNLLKTDYPQSKYLASAAQTDTKSLPEESEPVVATKPDTAVAPGETKPSDAEKGNVDAPVRATPELSHGQYTLQVGAYSQQVNAEKQKLFFEDLGYPVEVINNVRNNRSLFVVLVGDYRTADEARAKAEEFRKKYDMKSMVITR